MKLFGTTWTLVAWSALSCLALAGCDNPPARFHLNMLVMVNQGVTADQQQLVADALEAMWGTPDDPYVLEESGLDLQKIKLASGAVWNDQKTTKAGLFREHCAHCHGVTGDGMGPTAAFLSPYPRDYRQGIFKFKSTFASGQPSRPTREDLYTILYNGVPGTAMPSFKLLKTQELDALVEYVRYLSVRGETEIKMAAAIADSSDGKLTSNRTLLVDDILNGVATTWKNADADKIKIEGAPANFDKRSPEELRASIAAGKKLFIGDKAGCVKCHGPTALGDGQTTDYDDWSKAVNEFINKTAELKTSLSKNTVPEADRAAAQTQLAERLHVINRDVLAPRTAAPRNLRMGVYRGGRAPYDLYYRLYGGINGTPMPGIGATFKDSQEDIWHLIDYIQSLPYEPGGELGADRPIEFRSRL